MEPSIMNLNREIAQRRANLMRSGYKVGVRSKGFSFAAPGGQTVQNLNLSGEGSQFLGIAILYQSPTDLSVSLVINNDVVIDNTNAGFVMVQPQNQNRDYYEYLRPLNGQDSIILTVINNGANVTVNVVVYYIGA